MRSIRSFHRQRGNAAVEFALVMFVLFLIGAGLVEFGRAFWYYDAMSKGTRDAARYLSTMPLGSLGSESATAQLIVARAAAESKVPGFDSDAVSIACQPVACAAATQPSDISRIVVSVAYPLEIGALFPFLASAGSRDTLFSVTMTPRTSMPYMW